MMKKEMIEETIEIPEELAKRIQAELKMTPGLDFNTLLVQALNHWFSKQQNLKEPSLAELKERFIKDSSVGYGPKAIAE